MNTNFDEMPDGASDEQIDIYIKAFLNEKDDLINKNGIKYALEQLEQIADKAELNEESSISIYAPYINEISNFIEDYLDFNDDEIIDIILTIIINMHLKSVWNKIVTANNISNQKVVALIEDAKEENAKYRYFI